MIKKVSIDYTTIYNTWSTSSGELFWYNQTIIKDINLDYIPAEEIIYNYWINILLFIYIVFLYSLIFLIPYFLAKKLWLKK